MGWNIDMVLVLPFEVIQLEHKGERPSVLEAAERICFVIFISVVIRPFAVLVCLIIHYIFL